MRVRLTLAVFGAARLAVTAASLGPAEAFLAGLLLGAEKKVEGK